MNLLDRRGTSLSFVLTYDEAERLLDRLCRRRDPRGDAVERLIEKLIAAGVAVPNRTDRVRTKRPLAR